jgi:hypothetical protein
MNARLRLIVDNMAEFIDSDSIVLGGLELFD